MALPASARVTPESVFQEAAQAYDEGRYDEAAASYEQLLNDGARSPELYYNLGNAHYRMGDVGRAVLGYKRALYLAPRDADARHNLEFALKESDALNIDASLPDRMRSALPASAWSLMAVAAWWLTAFHIALSIRQPGRQGWKWASVLAGFILISSLWGVYYWMGLERYPEMVVLKPGQEALFAPIPGSTAHFSAPVGSVVRVEAISEDWLRIRAGGKTGWIKQESVESVATQERVSRANGRL
jgi:tetratricopeptide (TPR) repeat protein